MIRTCLEFLLSRSLDTDNPPAPWLQRRMQQDQQLKRFNAESKQLAAMFRRSAAEHRETMAVDVFVAPLPLRPQRRATAAFDEPGDRLSARWLGGLVAAAMLLVALLPNWLQPTAPAAHAGEFSQQLTVVPGEVLRLLTQAAKTSQTQLPQLSPLSNLTLPKMPAWEAVAHYVESPVRRELDTWQDNWQNLMSRLPESSLEL